MPAVVVVRPDGKSTGLIVVFVEASVIISMGAEGPLAFSKGVVVELGANGSIGALACALRLLERPPFCEADLFSALTPLTPGFYTFL